MFECITCRFGFVSMPAWCHALLLNVLCEGALTLISAGVILLLVGRCLTVAAL